MLHRHNFAGVDDDEVYADEIFLHLVDSEAPSEGQMQWFILNKGIGTVCRWGTEAALRILIEPSACTANHGANDIKY